jgi:hypothetical protein
VRRFHERGRRARDGIVVRDKSSETDDAGGVRSRERRRGLDETGNSRRQPGRHEARGERRREQHGRGDGDITHMSR